MKLHRSTIARLVFAIWAGIALFFMLVEHRAGNFGVWHYVLLLLCPALLYVATWNDSRSGSL